MTALDQHAEEPRWVAWRNERRGDKLTKVPYCATDKKAKADDPATWLCRAEAERVAAKIVNGLGGGVGYELGDLGNDLYIGGPMPRGRNETGPVDATPGRGNLNHVSQ